MKIGKLLKDRMDLLDMSMDTLIDATYIDEDILQNLYDNKIDFEDLDEYDQETLTNALFCSKNYFTDERERKFDIVMCSLNRGNEQDNIAIKTKCRLQRFVNDFLFVNELKNGSN